MGKLIKNHWARLIILTAAACTWSLSETKAVNTGANKLADQVAAAIEGFFWPKIFWDFLTKTLDGAVRPIPVLQVINLVFGLSMLALEWPLGFVAGSAIHRSLEVRLAILPLVALAAVLMYQATNPAIYYMIGMVVYFIAYSEGEVSFRCFYIDIGDNILTACRSSVQSHGRSPSVAVGLVPGLERASGPISSSLGVLVSPVFIAFRISVCDFVFFSFNSESI